jgi:uncharacterized lipoprotein YbaY
MKIEMLFKDVANDIEGAVADIRVEDASEADAPALQLSSKRAGPFSIRSSQPTVTVDVDLSFPTEQHELSLFVRVEAQTLNKETIKFLNTTTTPLSGDPNEFVRVLLERIV